MIALSRISLKFLFAIAAVAVLSGCLRQQPVLSVSDRQFPTDVAAKLTLDEVYDAISIAGAGRQDTWDFTRPSDNLIIAKINVRSKHTATVSIPFSQKQFSINYEGSTNLLYDGSQIHRNYNKWVGHLSDDIVASVKNAAATK